jgi:hypothetical protein
MNSKIVYLSLNQLKPHEHISSRRVKQLVRAIKGRELFTVPIIVDKKSRVILDGHHRVAALRRLGYTKVPAILVDYRSQGIRVCLRHKHLPSALIKALVLKTVSQGFTLPQKTTRHYLVKGRVRNIRCGLEMLR